MDYKWITNINQIHKESWVKIFGEGVAKSYELFWAMQNSNLQNSSFIYLVISKKNCIVAIIPCFNYKLDIGILAPSPAKSIIKLLRRVFGNLLYVNILGVGSLASTCYQHIGIIDSLKESEYLEVSNIIAEQIKSKSKETKKKLIFIKEVPQNELSIIKRIFSEDFRFYHSLPNCIVPIFQETIPYPIALKRKEKVRYKKIKKEFSRKYDRTIIEDYTGLVPIFEKLYLATLARSKNIFEVLNGNFFSLLNESLSKNSCMVVFRSKNGRIEAIGLILEDDQYLIPMYLGLNYDNSPEDLKLLHRYSLIDAIELAENKNKRYVKLGQTSYYPKLLSGAFVEDLYLGFYSYNSIINFFIKHVFKNLFSPTKVINHTYNDKYKDLIISKIKKDGFDISNH